MRLQPVRIAEYQQQEQDAEPRKREQKTNPAPERAWLFHHHIDKDSDQQQRKQLNAAQNQKLCVRIQSFTSYRNRFFELLQNSINPASPASSNSKSLVIIQKLYLL